MGYLRLEIQNKIEKSVLNENFKFEYDEERYKQPRDWAQKCKTDDAKGRWRVKYYETGDLFCAEAVFPIK